MRLFIALNLPKKEKERIHRSAKRLRDVPLPVRWIEPDHFHVTLKFLGEVRRERIPAIEDAMSRIVASSKAFTTRLSGFGAFPTIRRPRVIWLAVVASAELRCLKHDVEWTLGEAGFGAETRAFHPHVTLGRAAADDGGAGAFRGLDELMADMEFESDMKVQTLDLMQSRLSPSGSTYTLLSSAKLPA